MFFTNREESNLNDVLVRIMANLVGENGTLIRRGRSFEDHLRWFDMKPHVVRALRAAGFSGDVNFVQLAPGDDGYDVAPEQVRSALEQLDKIVRPQGGLVPFSRYDVVQALVQALNLIVGRSGADFCEGARYYRAPVDDLVELHHEAVQCLNEADEARRMDTAEAVDDEYFGGLTFLE